MIEFKKLDKEDTGYLSEINIANVFQILSMHVSNDEISLLMTMIDFK